MKKVLSILLVFICAMGLVACTNNESSKEENSKDVAIKIEEGKEKNIQKIESEEIDFSNLSYIASETEKDEKLEEAIKKAFDYETDEQMRYFYNKIDLNGDEKDEIFAYVVGSIASGSGGSTGLVFEVNEDEYKLVTNIALVRNPIIVSENKTNGWNDLILHVAGGGIEPFYARLKFNDNRYPGNPSDEPKVEKGTVIKGTAIICDDLGENLGIEL